MLVEIMWIALKIKLKKEVETLSKTRYEQEEINYVGEITYKLILGANGLSTHVLREEVQV